MKIKRVVAKDMRQGIRRVREELGEDAVILSNRKIDEGVEIVVGIDYDENTDKTTNSFVDEDAFVAHKQAQIEPQKSKRKNIDAQDFKTAIHSAAEELESFLGEELNTNLTYRKPLPRKRQTADNGSFANDNFESKRDNVFIDEMRTELKSLRGILENQVSGLAWGEMSRGKPQQAAILKKFLDMGLASTVSQDLVNSLPEDIDADTAWRLSLEKLAGKVITPATDFLGEGGVIALVGPTGVGKTTTIAKLAARFALQHGYQQVALVTTDSYRIGAHEQLRTYGRILGVPVRIANDADELRTTLEGLSDKRFVLIDTAGMSQRDLRLTEQFRSVLSGAPKLKTCVVLSANTQAQALDEVVKAFSKVKIDGCILTKVDEAVSLGGILSVVVKHKIPVTYMSDGQQVPEDLHRAHPHVLVNKAVTLLNANESNIDKFASAIAMRGGDA